MGKKQKLILFLMLITSLLVLFLFSCGQQSSEKEGKRPPAEISGGKEPQGLSGEGSKVQESDQMDAAERRTFQNFMENVDPQAVVARINEAEIKAWVVKDVSKIIGEQVRQQLGTLQPEAEKNLGKMALRSIIRSELIYQEAVKEGLTATEEELEAIMKKIKLKFIDEEKFQEFLKKTGCSEEELRKEEMKKVVIDKYLKGKILTKIKISEEDARDYYNNNKEKFKTRDLVRARYILFPLKKNASEAEKEEARKKAEDVLRKARAGEDFAELAKKYSGAPNADKGGDLDYFPRGVMVSNFDKYAFSLGIGEISDVFETPFGYNILKVEDKKEAGYMKFDEVKGFLIELLTRIKKDEMVDEKIEAIKKKARIEILLEGF